MHRFSKHVTVYVTAILISISTSACGGEPAVGEKPADASKKSSNPSITVVNGITSIEFIAADMAEELGTWDKLGLTVNYIHGSGGGGQVTTTLAANQADLGLHGAAPAAVAIAKGLPMKIVAVTANSFSGMVCVVAKDSNIRSFADLKGKTMGISSAGSVTDLVARLIAAKFQWKIGSDFKEAKIGDLSQLTAALQQGLVDLVCWSGEPAYTLVEKGTGRILDGVADIVGPNVFEGVMATDAAIKAKPDAIKKYLQGYFSVVKYMNDHPDETIKFLAKEENLTDTVAKKTYDTEMKNQSLDGSASQDQLAGLAKSVSILLGGTAPDPSEFWDPQFVPASS